jgi:hypothetical protein
MRSLRVVKVLSDSPAFARQRRLRLPKVGDTYSLGRSRGEGGFGEVWSVETTEARPGSPALAVKEVTEVQSLAAPVLELQQALERKPTQEWAERLLAFPFSIVVAELEGEEREAIFMLDLVELGYAQVKDAFDQSAVHEYRARPTYERVEFAHSYAQAASLLEAVGFIHGDQNIPNLMFNSSALDVQIIDLDAGAIASTGNERAIAEGKRDNCVPPEARVLGLGETDVDKSRWDVQAERWSVGILVGYLALSFDPSFFLKSSARVFGAFAQEGPWPRIDPRSPLLVSGGGAAYRHWLPHMEAAPGRLVETFARFFRAGTRGADRPTAQDWVEALDVAREKPRFVSIEVVPAVVPEGSEVVISWEAEGAERVEHPVLGVLACKGEASLAVDRSGRQTLTAINHYGKVQISTEVVRVVPLPKLTTIPMPGFPGLELQTRIATSAPPRPAPASPPRLAKAVGIPPAIPTLARGPRLVAAPPHFGELFKPISVDRRTRAKMRKEPTG